MAETAANKTIVERQWQAHGLDCLVLWIGNSYAEHGGHRTGYVRVPDDHPWFGASYGDDAPAGSFSPTADELDGVDTSNVLAMLDVITGSDSWSRSVGGQLTVHGGLTYSGQQPNDAVVKGHWFGFDCAHLDDTPLYWDEERTGAEVESLARQLAGVVIVPFEQRIVGQVRDVLGDEAADRVAAALLAEVSS